MFFFFSDILDEKDPEKRIALLQDKMAALRKEYRELRAKFIALDHKRRKARKKIREAGNFFFIIYLFLNMIMIT